MSKIYKGITSIGIVCDDNLKLSPVAAVIMRDLIVSSKNSNVRSIQIDHAGYKRTGNKVADSAIGFLQTHGFGSADYLEPKRINLKWLLSKDIIFTIDQFLKRDILYNYFSTKTKEMRDRILILSTAANINERIRDPKDDYNYDIASVYGLIEKCCKVIIKKIESAN